MSAILEAVARQARVATDDAHRPWPLPDELWSQAQTRRDVVFAHWSVPPGDLRRLLPAGLVADTFGGEAWIGLTACRVTAFRIRGLPPLPGIASFPLLEVSTPVTDGSRPGLWLFQVETTKQLVVESLKRTHRLPAYRAQLSVSDDEVEASRDGGTFAARFAPRGKRFTGEPGSLDHFLTERYALYTADGGRLYRAELNHPPWRLQRADAEIRAVTLAPMPLPGAPRVLYSASQDVLVWPLEEL